MRNVFAVWITFLFPDGVGSLSDGLLSLALHRRPLFYLGALIWWLNLAQEVAVKPHRPSAGQS